MLSCIVGTILCSFGAAIHIDGPLAYARAHPGISPYVYAIYAVPLQQPVYLPRRV